MNKPLPERLEKLLQVTLEKLTTQEPELKALVLVGVLDDHADDGTMQPFAIYRIHPELSGLCCPACLCSEFSENWHTSRMEDKVLTDSPRPGVVN